MAFINKIVDKVYVINLDKDVKRMGEISTQLAALGIEYTRFPAIQGAKMGHDKRISHFCETYCTDGMKGCAMSHKLIWEDMVTNGYSNVFVLEDDAILVEEFNEELERAWKQLPRDFDLFYLGCHMKCTDTGPIPQLITKLTSLTPKEVDTNILSVGGSFGTHGYIISNRCAKVFQNLSVDTHIDAQMDIWRSKFNLEAYSINPLIVTTDNDGNGSNLAETFPTLLNSLLRYIPISDSFSLSWSLSENSAKLGPFNINGLLVIYMLVVAVVPPSFYKWIGAWLLLESVASFDIKSIIKFVFFGAVVIGGKWFGRTVLYKAIHPSSK